MRAGTIAEAWFGQTVDRATVEQFARVLESVGLVRRDDHRRDRLWVLGVQETSLFPEEAELEEQLKQANPKGCLLAFCTRRRIDPPVTEIQPQGAFYEAKMSLCYEGRTLDSGPHRAASKKTAEQMAAQALLDRVSQGNDEHEVVRVASAVHVAFSRRRLGLLVIVVERQHIDAIRDGDQQPGCIGLQSRLEGFFQCIEKVLVDTLQRQQLLLK